MGTQVPAYMLPVMRQHYENNVLKKGEYTAAQVAKRLPDGKYLHIGMQKGWDDFQEFMTIALDIFSEKKPE